LSARDTIEQYRTAFVKGDVDALLDCFGFPVHVVGVTGDGASVMSASKDDWRRTVERLLDSYVRLGATDAVPLTLEVSEPLPAVSMVHVHWQLLRLDGSQVYDFRAVYTLAPVDNRPRIVAIAHDELSKLR
jgi:hypothetical protein